MSDQLTLKAYDADAARYVSEWLEQPTPREIHDLVRSHFVPGAPTADIGCGSGREVEWLNKNGFPTSGFDASKGLLEEARKRYPHCSFKEALLPKLSEIPDASYSNVLCETVIQHLPRESLPEALKSLVRILRSPGTLQLSWRLPRGAAAREDDGRLYTLIEFEEVRSVLETRGMRVVHQAEVVSASSGKVIRQLVLVRDS